MLWIIMQFLFPDQMSHPISILWFLVALVLENTAILFCRPAMAHAQGCLVTWTWLQRYSYTILISVLLKLYLLNPSLFLTFDAFSCSHLHPLLSVTIYDLSSNLGSHIFPQYPYALQSRKTSSLYIDTQCNHPRTQMF